MLRVTPLILAFLVTCTLSAKIVAGIDLATLQRPEGLELSANERRIEDREQARVRSALRLIQAGESEAATEDRYSKLDQSTIDRSHVREAGKQKIQEGTQMLEKGAENLTALYEAAQKRVDMLDEANETGLMRTWTSTDGRTVDAAFIDLVANQLKIQTPAGDEFVVPLDKLIERDQAAAQLMDSGMKLNAEDFLNAVETGRVSQIEKFMAAGYIPSTDIHGDALSICVRKGKNGTMMLKKLIDLEFEVDAYNVDGQTALSLAAKTGEIQAANYLLKAGASTTANDLEVNAPQPQSTETDETSAQEPEARLNPLLWAIHQGDSFMVLLLAKKTDDLSENMQGLVALAENEALKPISIDLLNQLLEIEDGETLPFQEDMDFKLKLFGLEPTMADLEKALINRSYRPYVVTFHGYDFYEYTLDRNREYIDVIIDQWRALDQQGIPGGSYSMALAELNGWGGEKDPLEATIYLKDAAEKDHSPSMILLGEVYEEGLIPGQKPYDAFNYYRKAAEIGDPMGMVKMGHCYEQGIHVDKDLKKAYTWYKRAVDEGSTEGMAQLGRCYMDNIGVVENTSTGLEWFTKAAEADNLSAMNYLGEAFLEGRGGRSDSNKGIEWLQRAAEFGDRAALLRLGQVYSDGTVRIEDKRASRYFLQAAERGELEAMYQIGRRLSTGTGIDKDKTAAFKWYQQAAEREHLDAINQLAVCYSNGEGVGRDADQAFMLFSKAAARDHMEAVANLAICYARGLGTTINQEESARLYLKVVNSGNTAAKETVAVLSQEQKK